MTAKKPPKKNYVIGHARLALLLRLIALICPERAEQQLEGGGAGFRHEEEID